MHTESKCVLIDNFSMIFQTSGSANLTWLQIYRMFRFDVPGTVVSTVWGFMSAEAAAWDLLEAIFAFGFLAFGSKKSTTDSARVAGGFHTDDILSETLFVPLYAGESVCWEVGVHVTSHFFVNLLVFITVTCCCKPYRRFCSNLCIKHFHEV